MNYKQYALILGLVASVVEAVAASCGSCEYFDTLVGKCSPCRLICPRELKRCKRLCSDWEECVLSTTTTPMTSTTPVTPGSSHWLWIVGPVVAFVFTIVVGGKAMLLDPLRAMLLDPLRVMLLDPLRAMLLDPLRAMLLDPLRVMLLDPLRAMLLDPPRAMVLDPIRAMVLDPIRAMLLDLLRDVLQHAQSRKVSTLSVAPIRAHVVPSIPLFLPAAPKTVLPENCSRLVKNCDRELRVLSASSQSF
ncbi:hypothetical protein NP493_979g01076 [Ridgeia piscesae]|uniref:Uncharacterized protein n=1 Tax=Ridgeia piscesae TaxID=27915 RepID=A0AAD9KJB6_RIDPI|nr:hypothetical protein NP493_979g01076 [Ridgeia piscesae]